MKKTVSETEITIITNPDDTNFEVKFKYWILVVGVIITTGIAFVVYKNVPGAEIRDIVTIVTGGVVSTTLIYHVMNYHLNYDVNIVKFRYDNNKIVFEQKSNAIKMIGEWLKPEMMRHTILARDFLDSNKMKSGSEIDKQLKDSESTRLAIVMILNLFETIAIAISERVIDEKIMKSFFRGLFNEYYHGTHQWILFRREARKNNKIFENFVALNSRWNDHS